MYEQILSDILCIRAYGGEPSVIYMTVECYEKCENRIHCFKADGIEVRVDDRISNDYIIM